MKLTPVSSPKIKSVGWEYDVLYVQFIVGGLFAYYNVTGPEYINFMKAPSLETALKRIEQFHSFRRM